MVSAVTEHTGHYPSRPPGQMQYINSDREAQVTLAKVLALVGIILMLPSKLFTVMRAIIDWLPVVAPPLRSQIAGISGVGDAVSARVTTAMSTSNSCFDMTADGARSFRRQHTTGAVAGIPGLLAELRSQGATVWVLWDISPLAAGGAGDEEEPAVAATTTKVVGVFLPPTADADACQFAATDAFDVGGPVKWSVAENWWCLGADEQKPAAPGAEHGFQPLPPGGFDVSAGHELQALAVVWAHKFEVLPRQASSTALSDPRFRLLTSVPVLMAPL